MNKKFIFGLSVFILLFGSSFVLSDAEEGSVEVVRFVYEVESNIGNLINPDFAETDVIVDDITFEKEGGISTLTFNPLSKYSRSTGRIKIGENDFSRISSKSNQVSFLKIDSAGKIIEADLWIASGKTNQEIVFGENKISVPPYSRVIYKNGQVRVINNKVSGVPNRFMIREWADNSEELILENPPFEYYDENGAKHLFEHGNVIRYDGEKYYFRKGDKVSYKGFEFVVGQEGSSVEKMNFYTDGLVHEGEAAISLGKTSFAISSGDDPNIGKIVLKGDSDYYKLFTEDGKAEVGKRVFVDELDYTSRENLYEREIEIELVNPDSSIRYTPGRGGGRNAESNYLDFHIPTLEASNGYSIKTGDLWLENRDGLLYQLQYEGEINTALEIVIKDPLHEEFHKQIQIGENSGLALVFFPHDFDFIFTEDTEPPRRNIFLKRFNWEDKSVLYHIPGQNTYFEQEFRRIKNDLLEASALLDQELINIYGEENLVDFFASRYLENPLDELNEDVLKYSLSPQKVLKILGADSTFFSDIKLIEDMTFYKPVVGEYEGSSTKDLQHYGVRTGISIIGLDRNPEIMKKVVRAVLKEHPRYLAQVGSKEGPGYFSDRR